MNATTADKTADHKNSYHKNTDKENTYKENSYKENTYKGIVFFDLDGTLLDNSCDQVPESAGQALRELRKNGYLICLSTGRDMDTHYSEKYLKMVEPDAVIHLNGSKITIGGGLFFMHYMDRALLRRILEFAEKNGFCAGTSIGSFDYFLFPELKTAADLSYNRFIRRNYRPVEELFEKEIPVIAVSFAGPDTRKIKALAEAAIPEIRLFPFNSNTGADVVETGFSKADGMRRICEHYGIEREKTWAFGDSANDLPMFREAGCSVAMGNAGKEVQEAASFVTAAVGEDGIAKALQKLGLI